MSGTGCQRKTDDPYEPVPAWRVDEIERRIDRAERRTEHAEDRITGLSETMVQCVLIGLVALAATFAIVAAVASHH